MNKLFFSCLIGLISWTFTPSTNVHAQSLRGDAEQSQKYSGSFSTTNPSKTTAKDAETSKKGVVELIDPEEGIEEMDVPSVKMSNKELEKRLDYFHKGTWKHVTKQSSEKKKPLMVDFYTDWCRVCKQMDQETFADEEVTKNIKKNYIAYRLDAEKQKEVAEQYDVHSFPTFIFISPDGKELGRITSYLTKEAFKKELNKYKIEIPHTKYSEFR